MSDRQNENMKIMLRSSGYRVERGCSCPTPYGKSGRAHLSRCPESTTRRRSDV